MVEQPRDRKKKELVKTGEGRKHSPGYGSFWTSGQFVCLAHYAMRVVTWCVGFASCVEAVIAVVRIHQGFRQFVFLSCACMIRDAGTRRGVFIPPEIYAFEALSFCVMWKLSETDLENGQLVFCWNVPLGLAPSAMPCHHAIMPSIVN